MRRLESEFMNDLKDGHLSGIISCLKEDDTLDFQIRENEIHLYYRGGRILGLEFADRKYKASFDLGYCKAGRYKDQLSELPKTISSKEASSQWIHAFPILKQTVDIYLATGKDKTEREFQQLVVRENNNSKIAGSTDYFIIDIEYTSKGQTDMGRFDMVAFAWPANKRQSKKVALSFIEMKFGEKALDGEADIKKHIKDMDNFLGYNKNLANIQDEMIEIFKQKRELGLIKSILGKNYEIKEIANDKPDFILLIAGYTHRSKRLHAQLKEAPQMENAKLKIATANFMGYALYSNSIYNLGDFIDKFSDQIYSK